MDKNVTVLFCYLYHLLRLHSVLTKKNVARTAKQEDRRKWERKFKKNVKAFQRKQTKLNAGCAKAEISFHDKNVKLS